MVLFNQKNIVKSIFPNNEKQYYNLNELCRYSPHNVVTLIYENNGDLFDLAMVKKWFDNNVSNDAPINLRMDFCPYGQSDRQMGDALFSFKYFAQFINSLNFNQVIICDPHSLVMDAALDKCFVEYPMTGVNFDDYGLWFYPDNGAAKKYSELYNKPYRFGNKKRDLATGKIISYEIIADNDDIWGKSILIRDDLIMGGRTFIEAAKALKDMGAERVDLFITHIMPQAENFYNHYKEYGIDNFYSENTLRMPWYHFPQKNPQIENSSEGFWAEDKL